MRPHAVRTATRSATSMLKAGSASLTLLVLAASAIPLSAHAQTIAASDSGWYDDTGSHTSGNYNFLAGYHTNPGFPVGHEYRDFLIYNVPMLASGFTYTSASLQFQLQPTGTITLGLAGDFSSTDPTETYNLCDVSTSISSLSGGSGGLAAFNDLATGVSYGSRVFSNTDNGTTVTMTLNSAGLSALNAEQGGQMVFGGFVSTISGTSEQTVFNFSNAALPVGSALVLGSAAAPEPGSFVLLAAGGLVFVGKIARRRRTGV